MQDVPEASPWSHISACFAAGMPQLSCLQSSLADMDIGDVLAGPLADVRLIVSRNSDVCFVWCSGGNLSSRAGMALDSCCKGKFGVRLAICVGALARLLCGVVHALLLGKTDRHGSFQGSPATASSCLSSWRVSAENVFVVSSTSAALK